MRERKKRKSPYHWVAMVMVFTVAITSLFVLVLYLDSPDVFLIKKVDSETGEVSCSFNYEKAYDLFICEYTWTSIGVKYENFLQETINGAMEK